jgi:hypothetical protein
MEHQKIVTNHVHTTRVWQSAYFKDQKKKILSFLVSHEVLLVSMASVYKITPSILLRLRYTTLVFGLVEDSLGFLQLFEKILSR